MIKISHVPTEYVNTCWKDVEGYLKGATDRTNGRYEIEDLYLSVCEYGHLLWIAFDDKTMNVTALKPLAEKAGLKCLNRMDTNFYGILLSYR